MADEQVTFRHFAAAVMGNDDAEAGRVLGILLALAPEPAAAAVRHFRAGMAGGGQEFMGKAMGLRGAVTSGDEARTRGLLGDCFGLEGATLDGAVAELGRRYPRG